MIGKIINTIITIFAVLCVLLLILTSCLSDNRNNAECGSSNSSVTTSDVIDMNDVIHLKEGLNIIEFGDRVKIKCDYNTLIVSLAPTQTMYEYYSDIWENDWRNDQAVFLKIHTDKTYAVTYTKKTEKRNELFASGGWVICATVKGVIDVFGKCAENESIDEYQTLVGKKIILYQRSYVAEKNGEPVLFCGYDKYVAAVNRDMIVRFSFPAAHSSAEELNDLFDSVNSLLGGINDEKDYSPYKKFLDGEFYGPISEHYPAVDLNGASLDDWKDFLNSLKQYDELYAQKKKRTVT